MPQNPSEAQIAAALKEEGQAILAKIAPQSFVTAMCIEGQMLSSEQLAQQIAARACRAADSLPLSSAAPGDWMGR